LSRYGGAAETRKVSLPVRRRPLSRPAGTGTADPPCRAGRRTRLDGARQLVQRNPARCHRKDGEQGMTVARLQELDVAGKALPLPVYFPSISSVKTALPPQDYLQVLASLVGLNGQYLVSAFDLAALGLPAEAATLMQTSRDA